MKIDLTKHELAALLAFAATNKNEREGMCTIQVGPGWIAACDGCTAISRGAVPSGDTLKAWDREPFDTILKSARAPDKITIDTEAETVSLWGNELKLEQRKGPPLYQPYKLAVAAKPEATGFGVDPRLLGRLNKVSKATKGAGIEFYVGAHPTDAIRVEATHPDTNVTWHGLIMPMRIPTAELGKRPRCDCAPLHDKWCDDHRPDPGTLTYGRLLRGEFLRRVSRDLGFTWRGDSVSTTHCYIDFETAIGGLRVLWDANSVWTVYGKTILIPHESTPAATYERFASKLAELLSVA